MAYMLANLKFVILSTDSFKGKKFAPFHSIYYSTRATGGPDAPPPTILRADCFCDLLDHMIKMKDVNKKKVGSHPLKLTKIQNGRHATNLKICGS